MGFVLVMLGVLSLTNDAGDDSQRGQARTYKVHFSSHFGL